jgi:predicted ATPase
MTPAEWYRARLAHWTALRDTADRRGAIVSRLRLISFLGAAALAWWGLSAPGLRTPLLFAAAAAMVGFAILVVRHARIIEEVERADAAIALTTQGLARLARDWNALPDVASPCDLDRHPYACDLDVFGHASLTKWIGRPATIEGTERLWSWLLAPAASTTIVERQQAVDELATVREWRERLDVEGVRTAITPEQLQRFLAWAEATASAVPSWMQFVALAIPVAIAVLGGLFFTGVTDAAWWLIPMLMGIVLSFIFAMRIHPVFDQVTVGQRALEGYARMLALACDTAWSSATLADLKGGMCIGGAAPALVAKLARLGSWSELRTGAALLHFPVQALTMWDFHVYFAMERWRTRSGRHVRGWIEALGSFDALAALARVRADEPEWTVPRVDPAATALAATALGHVLIAGSKRVSNDVQVGPRGTVLLITGSNMSGKSTLLRAIGLNTVLAQAGAPVCAASFVMPPAQLYTSIRVQDSLELGLSYFMAALARLKQIVDAAEANVRLQDDAGRRVLLFLLDEVLQGTNSVERDLAVRAVVRHLLDAGAIGAMTTHDLALAGEEPLASAATLAHFTEQVHADGTMTFDYRLRPGLATSTNALRLMQLIGITPR